MNEAWEEMFALLDEIAATSTPEEIAATWAEIEAMNLGGPTVAEYPRMMGFSTWSVWTTLAAAPSDLPAVAFEQVHAAGAVPPPMNIGPGADGFFGERVTVLKAAHAA